MAKQINFTDHLTPVQVNALCQLAMQAFKIYARVRQRHQAKTKETRPSPFPHRNASDSQQHTAAA
jgi:hypothetical protein